MAAKAVELGEKHQILQIPTDARCVLGHARARLGRASEGIALIRQEIQGALETGARFPGITLYATLLGQAPQRSGAIVEAPETIEQALQANPPEYVYRPETFRVRGELRLELRQAAVRRSGFSLLAAARPQHWREGVGATHHEPDALARGTSPSRRSSLDARQNLQLVSTPPT